MNPNILSTVLNKCRITITHYIFNSTILYYVLGLSSRSEHDLFF